MKRYKNNAKLIILNIALEYVIIFSVYIVCGIIRASFPAMEGRHFDNNTIIKFCPFILAVATFMICVFWLLGDYLSIHFKNIRKIILNSFIVSLFAGVFGSAILFFVEGSQFSRMLLVMVVAGWSVSISMKRYILMQIANRFMYDKIATCNVLIMGNGENAKKYYDGLINDSSSRYTYMGYIAKEQDPDMDLYLGEYGDLRRVIENNVINKVVIADDEPTRQQMGDTLSICAVLGIEVIIVPNYSDYIIDNQKVRTENGVHVLNISAFNHSNILGVNIAVTDMDRTINEIKKNLVQWRGKYICVSNVHTTVMAHENEEYRKVQNEAVMALPDGGPLSSYSRAEGKTEARRVTGPDLMKEMLIQSRENGWRHFFYGSTPKTLDMLKEKIEKDYDGAIIAGMISPPYRELTIEEDLQYIEEINKSKPDFIWVGLGAPKQEIWMAAHQDKVNGLMIGVGAAFDYESGNLKRAPKWMQKCNLEWLYRFMQEPRRLFKRYFVTNMKFMWLTRR